MNKRILFCATIDIHFKAFHLPYLKWFKDQGWEVHVAAAGEMDLPFVDKKYNIPIKRSPLSLMNIQAYKELKAIIDENKYSMIHCHTPMGGVLTRLAARDARKGGTKVLYTAHGFHFCKGAPFINWALYYPIEKFLSHYTDCLITINIEDYHRALSHRFKAGLIKHIHGVGVNTDIFYPVGQFHKFVLRAERGYNPEDFLMFYAAEFNKNKNQQFLIKALALIKDELPKTRLLLAGDGPLLEECKKLAINLGIEEKVHFLGFRDDIEALLKMSDIAVASSYREGLPVNVMEAMACGLPVIASDNRGHRELIRDEGNGWLVQLLDGEYMSEKIKLLSKNEEMRVTYGSNGSQTIKNKYAIDKVLIETINIYEMFMEDGGELRWAVQ
jgi:glycosyltransferase EpsD